MTREEHYQKHIDSMFGTKNMETFTHHEIDEVLANLLECIPNDGKLYKYRRIDDEDSFQRVYDSLKNGTLWASRVDKFPDKTDCTIYFDPLKEVQRMETLFRNNPELILRVLMRGISQEVLKINSNFDDSMLIRLVDCFDNETGMLDERKALKLFSEYGCEKSQSCFALNWIKAVTVQMVKEKESLIKNMANNFVNFNQTMRHRAFVCSLCEDYKVKTMWEHYAGNNGICIEYDYKKLKAYSYNQKRLFCSTYKIRYMDEYEEQTFVPMLEEYLEGVNKKSTNTELNKRLLLCQVTKTTEYAYEKEWRTFHYDLHELNDGFALKADLVTGIIFDEGALFTENGKKILTLCEKYGWNILVRKLNLTSTNYQFLPYENYLKITNSLN